MRRRSFLCRLVAGAAGLFGLSSLRAGFAPPRPRAIFCELLARLRPFEGRYGSPQLEINHGREPSILFDCWIGPEGVPEGFRWALWRPGLVQWNGRTWRLSGRDWWCASSDPAGRSCRAYFRAVLVRA